MTHRERSHSPRDPEPPEKDPLLSLRAAIILTMATMAGLVMGFLVHASRGSLPAATSTGCGAACVVLLGLHQVIEG